MPDISEEQIAQARHTFLTTLTLDEQLTLMQEIIETRSDELKRAYKNLVGFSCGFRLRRASDTGVASVHREPCITFIVKKKWSVAPRQRAGMLPRHLLAYATVGGERRLCAIPTDTDQSSMSGEFRLDTGSAPSRIMAATNRQGFRQDGTLTCALTRSLLGDRLFTLSCRHVFSPSEERSQNPATSAIPVNLPGAGTEVARTQAIGGAYLPEPAVSLDAQLAKVTSPQGLVAALGDARLTDVVRTDTELMNLLMGNRQRVFWILTQHGPVPVEFMKQEHEPLGEILHRLLLRWKFVDANRVTEPGDSGAPVVTEETGGLLIGMHIGVHRATTSEPWSALTVPAVDLFQPRNYGIPPTDHWELLQPENLSRAGAPPASGTTPPPAPTATPQPIATTLDRRILLPLMVDHGYPLGAPLSDRWRLSDNGLRIEGQLPEVTIGPPQTVERVWTDFGADIRAWGNHFDVPVELIIATICTESRGNPRAIRQEPGYQSDTLTPGRVSIGLMQTLISTARETLAPLGLPEHTIDRGWLCIARNSIQAGTAYIREQYERSAEQTTRFDPPLVACAYNAGSLILNTSEQNRWKLKQFPIGTSAHADRFVEWFNDCFRLFETSPEHRPSAFGPAPSLFELIRRR